MKKEDISEYVLIGIISFGLLFWFIIMPIVVAYGVISGRLDIETLEPVKVYEQVIDDTMIQEGLDGY